MANLNFKWGNHESLAKLTTSEVGTLYFTKDEGSLYLGVDASQKPRRIQGVVQYYADLNAFKAEVLPPYSADVIYYIASEGALVKWKEKKAASGDSAATSGEFVVLNVTASEFSAAVTNLSNDIADNASDIADNTTDITNLRKDLGESTAAAGDATAFARIKQLEAAVAVLEEFAGIGGGSEGDSLTVRIQNLEAWKETADGDIKDLKSDVADHNTKISDLQTDMGEAEDRLDAIDGEGGRMAVAEGRLDAIDGTDGRMASAENRLDAIDGEGGRLAAIEGDIADLKQDTQDNAKDIEDVNKLLGTNDNKGEIFTRIANLEAASEDNGGDIESLTSRMDAVDGENGRLANAESRLDAIDGTNGRLASLESDVADNAKDISDMKTDIGDAEDRLDAIDGENGRMASAESRLNDIDGENGRMASAEDRLDDVEGRLDAIDGATGRLKNLEDDVADNAKEISDIKQLYQTKEDAATQHQELEDLIKDEIDAANALTYIGGVGNTSEWNAIINQNAPIGTTYVVSSAESFSINGIPTAVYPGDLLIATKKEGTNEGEDGTLAAGDIKWVHVQAGYNEELADELSVVSAEGGASVRLTSYPGVGSGNYGDLGNFTIVSDSKNIAINVADSAIKVSMVWDTF